MRAESNGRGDDRVRHFLGGSARQRLLFCQPSYGVRPKSKQNPKINNALPQVRFWGEIVYMSVTVT